MLAGRRFVDGADKARRLLFLAVEKAAAAVT